MLTAAHLARQALRRVTCIAHRRVPGWRCICLYTRLCIYSQPLNGSNVRVYAVKALKRERLQPLLPPARVMGFLAGAQGSAEASEGLTLWGGRVTG